MCALVWPSPNSTPACAGPAETTGIVMELGLWPPPSGQWCLSLGPEAFLHSCLQPLAHHSPRAHLTTPPQTTQTCKAPASWRTHSSDKEKWNVDLSPFKPATSHPPDQCYLFLEPLHWSPPSFCHLVQTTVRRALSLSGRRSPSLSLALRGALWPPFIALFKGKENGPWLAVGAPNITSSLNPVHGAFS